MLSATSGKQIHPRLNESVASDLKSSHPSLKIHRTSVVFHELHEPIQEYILSTFDEMWSKKSFEVVHSIHRIPQ